MKFRELFSISEGKRITEKHLYRVLVSSICGILLCMVCIAGTTWAWFGVSIENTGNVIQIEEPVVMASVDGYDFQSESELTAGEHELTVRRIPKADDLNQNMKFYISLIFSYTSGEEEETVIYQTAITESASITITTDTVTKLGIRASLQKPENAQAMTGNTISIEAEETTDSPADSTGSTEGSAPSDGTATPPETDSGENNQTETDSTTDTTDSSEETASSTDSAAGTEDAV